MSNIIWKTFKLGDLFARCTEEKIGINQKDINLKEKSDIDYIALISASKKGSGCVGYLNDDIAKNISLNKITFDDQWGYTYFQTEPFVITGGHNAILEVKSNKLKSVLDKNLICYKFISHIINKITVKSDIFGYRYKINNKFDRELILLPCISLSSSDDYIWEDNNNYYTLAVDYIKKLMDSAKKLKEEKTIKLYEKERAKYEAERVKYEAAYVLERSLLVWKEFKLGDIFVQSTEHYLNKSKKNYKINKEKTTEFCVAVCAASKYNNGIVGYINEIDDVPEKKRKVFLTKSGFGNVFYQDDWFIKPGGSWGMLNIVKFKDEKIKRFFDNNKILYKFISKTLTKILVQITTWQFTPNFDNEILLLPLIEVSKIDDYIWEDNSHYYTLATNYISYLYLTGRINKYQKLIDEYTYK